MGYDVDFGDFKDELIIVENGETTTYLLTQTTSNGVEYTHTLSASGPDYSLTSTATGGNEASNTTTRDLLSETIEGVTRNWSDTSSTTVTPAGTTTSWSTSENETTYKFARSLSYQGAVEGWHTLHYAHHTFHDEHTDYPDGTSSDYGWDLRVAIAPEFGDNGRHVSAYHSGDRQWAVWDAVACGSA